MIKNSFTINNLHWFYLKKMITASATHLYSSSFIFSSPVNWVFIMNYWYFRNKKRHHILDNLLKINQKNPPIIKSLKNIVFITWTGLSVTICVFTWGSWTCGAITNRSRVVTSPCSCFSSGSASFWACAIRSPRPPCTIFCKMFFFFSIVLKLHWNVPITYFQCIISMFSLVPLFFLLL